MAGARKKRLFYNLISIFVLTVMLLLSLAGADRVSALALEQDVRCGMEEHVHSESCYIDDVLVCGQKMHAHSQKCYLVRLEDNDVNQLVETVGSTDDMSLESVIASPLVRTLSLNESFDGTVVLPSAGIAPDDTGTGDEWGQFVIVEEQNAVPLATAPAELLAAPNGSGGISTLAVGGNPSTGTRVINFYIQLNRMDGMDGKITFINSGTLQNGQNNNPDYYSYSNTVSAYTSVVITGLSTDNIRNPYYFRYNTDGQTSAASDFDSNASYQNSQVRFGNNNNTRYAILTTRSGWNNNYTYTPVDFYTVTLDYSQSGTAKANDVQYVQSGMDSTLTLSDEYLWYTAAEGGTQVTTTTPGNITGTKTLYARPKNVTVTYVVNGATMDTDTLKHGEDYTVRALPSGYDENDVWLDEAGNEYAANSTIKNLKTSLTLTATRKHSVTFDYPETDKADVTTSVIHGEKVTLPEGYTWSDGTTNYEGGAEVTVTKDTVFAGTVKKYTVTWIDATGATTTETVEHGKTVTFGVLPEGYAWIGSDDSSYAPGAVSAPITADVTFTAAEKTIRVHYNVNFPSNAVNAVDSVPTIYGTTSATVTDLVPGGQSAVTRTLTSRTARDEISSGNKESRTYFFKGWTITGMDDLLIPADSTLSWSELEAYADGVDEVNLVGVWENGTRYNSVTFFVRFDSVAVDIEGNITSQPTSNYTPEIFNTHVGGVNTSWSDSKIKDEYEIADTTSDNSFGADQAIRAMYGEKAEGIWLYDFPKDEDVFTYLKTYLSGHPDKSLSVDEETVDPNELDSEHYAIRWYVFKLEGSTWHVDGKLVRKEGTITVNKAFGGLEEVLTDAENGFYVVAENGTMGEDGVFTPYPSSHKNYNTHVLTLDQATANRLKSQYSDAEFLVYETGSAASHSYGWKITGVLLGEYWRITEYPQDVAGTSYYAEYSVYDTNGEFTAIAEYGTQASVIGKAFALDEDPDQGLLVNFQNYYYDEESILIKKEDAKTGRPIGGAVFELWQGGTQLSFNYNEVTGQYQRDEDGDGEFTQIVTASDGFSIISTTGFSYSYGDVVVKEVVAPQGYDRTPDITIGTQGSGDVGIKDVAGVNPEDWSDYAEVPNNDVLVVKDHTSEYISVTATKVWNTNAPADSVEVVLQANGSNAAAMFPGLSNAQVVLNAANHWTYTWEELPRYGNGQLVSWSVKEVVVGGMPTLSDGSSFANWIVTYSPGVGTDSDSDGDIDNWAFTVTNATRRPQLILTKVGNDGVTLAGATFSLEQVELKNGAWQSVAGTTVSTLTTAANGMLTFDQLLAGAYYRLTEVSAPEGYLSVLDPVVISVNGEGLVQQVASDGKLTNLDHDYVVHTGAYNIQVINLNVKPLPETGGIGTYVYTQGGLLLMLAAAVLYGYNHHRRKEEQGSS